MITTQVRPLSDGEELVIEDRRSPSRSFEAPRGAASFARRHQAMSELRGFGADTDTPPLAALDVEPAGSVTDEGVASAAAVTRLR
jgi:hypothetical protein